LAEDSFYDECWRCSALSVRPVAGIAVLSVALGVAALMVWLT
jgi:hypothetical protein